MSTIRRPGGGADEGTPGDHAGRAAGQSLGGFEERLLAELKQVVAQHAAATHPQPGGAPGGHGRRGRCC